MILSVIALSLAQPISDRFAPLFKQPRVYDNSKLARSEVIASRLENILLGTKYGPARFFQAADVNLKRVNLLLF